jgi:hypothetical protein
LYLELLEDEQFRGRVDRDDDGRVRISFYEAVANVPWHWLAALAQRFKGERDLTPTPKAYTDYLNL